MIGMRIVLMCRSILGVFLSVRISVLIVCRILRVVIFLLL